MWYSLYIQCPLGLSPHIRPVAVFYNAHTGFFLFNFCDFSNGALNCHDCERFCKEYITSHPDSNRVIGDSSHPLNS